jgi:hypothetical protein
VFYGGKNSCPNQNYIHNEIKNRLNSGNACYHSVTNLTEKLQITVYKETVILPVVIYGCENWSLPLREEQRLRIYDNSVLKRYLDLKGRKTVRGENCVMMKFMAWILHLTLL